MREPSRKPCTECPWRLEDEQSRLWQERVMDSVKSGKIPGPQHRCHMISKETWDELDASNVCIGSLKKSKRHDK